LREISKGEAQRVNLKSYLNRRLAAVVLPVLMLLNGCASSPRQEVLASEVIALWHATPPNARTLAAAESQVVKDLGWRSIIEVHNVSSPSMTIVRPPAGQANGSAMLVLPGGAFSILAWDAEGTEVADFLAKRGITAFVLKYRVSDPTPEEIQAYVAKMSEPGNAADPMFAIKQLVPRAAPAIDDALQAMRLVRANAKQYGIDPNRIGMIGFSAGAITTFSVLQRADDATRPNIAAPIYGLAFENGVPAKTPPLFMAVAKDDPVMASASADIQKAWSEAGRTSELHVLDSGEHGFGLGKPSTDSMRFSGLLETWLRTHGFIRAGA
jgi:acetyl esterase/lipase